MKKSIKKKYEAKQELYVVYAAAVKSSQPVLLLKSFLATFAHNIFSSSLLCVTPQTVPVFRRLIIVVPAVICMIKT